MSATTGCCGAPHSAAVERRLALLSAAWAITTGGNQSGLAVAPASQKLRRSKCGMAVALAVVSYGCRTYQPKTKMCGADGRRRWAPPLSALRSMDGRWKDQVLRRMGVARQKDGRSLQTRRLRVGKQSSGRPVGLGPGLDSCVPTCHQAMVPLCTGSQVTASMRAGHRATVTCAPDQSSPIRPLCPLCAPVWTNLDYNDGVGGVEGGSPGSWGLRAREEMHGGPWGTGESGHISGGVCQGADRA